MQFASIRVITNDVARLAGFYERVTGLPVEWRSDLFAEVIAHPVKLAIGSAETVALFGAGSAEPESNRTVIIEFRVDDVDAAFERLGEAEVVQKPTTMPWGNRSLLFRDPDGNLVNFFTPPA
ncbi:Glyoxalase/Bleomycin resistance protein/Dioxygenase superfamily protein [Lentzea fradiae]|uniref:Glyoxalase/Bleomycin resistance protein/Dioxygenase superfamily protein n=1 Tax=Lentzea fradiae TaxID=200378 RepID=A0A1G7LY53_9PSEU|nr:VOC family protein [Lentzea fradiae]SDF54331.1 Glyoxalase/Bleomycin resistance protein/Dioxygenase superfamily protein [Lentzea fradiae]